MEVEGPDETQCRLETGRNKSIESSHLEQNKTERTAKETKEKYDIKDHSNNHEQPYRRGHYRQRYVNINHA